MTLPRRRADLVAKALYRALNSHQHLASVVPSNSESISSYSSCQITAQIEKCPICPPLFLVNKEMITEGTGISVGKNLQEPGVQGPEASAFRMNNLLPSLLWQVKCEFLIDIMVYFGMAPAYEFSPKINTSRSHMQRAHPLSNSDISAELLR